MIILLPFYCRSLSFACYERCGGPHGLFVGCHVIICVHIVDFKSEFIDDFKSEFFHCFNLACVKHVFAGQLL